MTSSCDHKLRQRYCIGRWHLYPGTSCPLQWRRNGHDGVSNHRRLDCLPNRLFRRRSKTPKLHVTGLCVGNSLVTGEFPAQRASNAKKFPFDNAIMPVSCLLMTYAHFFILLHWSQCMKRSNDKKTVTFVTSSETVLTSPETEIKKQVLVAALQEVWSTFFRKFPGYRLNMKVPSY